MRPRLVGAIVLAALAAILLPMLLDFEGNYTVDTRSQIPARPDIVPIDIDQPQPVVSNEPVQTAEQMFRFDSSREEAEAETDTDTKNALKEDVPGLSDEGVPLAWILQVASFSDADKANSLTEKLQADEYRAYSRASTASDKAIYRVYVGPKILKQTMLDEKLAIEQKYKLKTLLLRFEP